ncbi:hypothetical protein [Halobacteriovorax sp. YZS-1-2]|uniref:hypothetical protein n=1 Tax=Halobacteriovorax sp. YZS-1-2 TaxID=3391177 RepID=UPI00399BDE98
MTSIMRDLLLVQSFNLSTLIEEYRLFFLSLLPSVFILAVIIEYFDRLEPFTLVKRAFISILILTTVTSVYESSIASSMDTADQVLREQKQQNILLMDFFDGFKHWDNITKDKEKDFFKERNAFTGALAFLKYHLFDSFVNDGFTITIYFITKLCFVILKVVYSLVYYLGYGLIGIPCLIYLFPSMGNVLRGAILSYLWCLIIPHVLVFIISMIGTEINKGYVSGHIIGGSMMGTTLLFILTLFIAFTPLIGAMILNGSGISQAGGIIASIGANYVMNLPKNTVNNAAMMATGSPLGPKATFAKGMAKGGYQFAKKAKIAGMNKFTSSGASSRPAPKQAERVKPTGLGHTHIKGHIPPHVNDSDYVTLKNSNKSSGVDFISAPTRKNPAYKSKQVHQIKPKVGPKESTNQQSNKRSVSNGTVQKHGKVHRPHQKTSNIYRSNKRTNSRPHSRNRNINQPQRRQ